MAIFKGLYRGEGIYWHGKDGYGDELGPCGNGTMQERRDLIDAMHEQRDLDDIAKFSEAVLKGYRDGDLAKITYKGDVVFEGTMRQARRIVFDLSDQYESDICWNPE